MYTYVAVWKMGAAVGPFQTKEEAQDWIHSQEDHMDWVVKPMITPKEASSGIEP